MKYRAMLVVVVIAMLVAGCDAPQPLVAQPAESLVVSRIAVVSAFKAELALLLEQTDIEEVVVINGRTFTLGTLEGLPVVEFLSGVSMVNAAMTMQLALDNFPIERIVYSGIAGGVNPDLHIGDVTVPSQWAQYQEAHYARDVDGVWVLPSWKKAEYPNFGMSFPESIRIVKKGNEPDKGEKMFWFPVDAAMLRVARYVAATADLEECTDEGVCLEHDIVVKVGGNGVSGMTFVDNADYRDYTWATFEVDALDMETSAVAHVAYANDVPYIAFRSLSDLAGGGEGENLIGTFFKLAANNSANLLLSFFRAWGQRDTLPELPKVAFVYVGPIGDMGWTYAHDVARLELEQVLGVETTFIENIVEGADTERVMRDFIGKGYTIIFATADGYRPACQTIAEDPTLGIAAAITAGKQPPIAIHCIEGVSEIYEGYFGRMYRPRYLSGMIAGAMTKTNIIGYVAAHQIPQVIKGINGFTLGARAMNPDAEVRVVWTNTWFDPPLEYEAAEALLDAGADIIAQHQDSTMPQEAAKARGVLGIGYDTDMAQYVGDTVLTSPVWDWGIYYVDRVQTFIEGNWTPTKYFSGDVVSLAPVSDRVPDDVFSIVQEMERLIDGGEWDVFCGPIYNNAGELMVADGECLDDDAINGMNWYVAGVKE